MVATFSDERIKQFEELFAIPTIPSILAYPWQHFEGFVEYVFSCAGYAVVNVSQQKWPNGPGVDLELYTEKPSSKLVAYVEVRRYTPPHNIDSDEAHAFANKLNVKGVPGYIVTTSDFVAGAKAVAATATKKRVRLVNGDHLIRYINYIRGSRIVDAVPKQPTTPAPTPPDILFQADDIQRREVSKTRVLTVGKNHDSVESRARPRRTWQACLTSGHGCAGKSHLRPTGTRRYTGICLVGGLLCPKCSAFAAGAKHSVHECLVAALTS